MVYNASVTPVKSKQINLIDFVKKIKLNNVITQKKYATKDKGEYVTFFDPANKIPDGAMCSYELCKRKDGQFHLNTCPTPLRKYLIFSEKGIKKYTNEITKFMRDNNVPQNHRYKIFHEELPLGFKKVFPKILKNEWTLENMISLKYNDITVRVSSSGAIHIVHGNESVNPVDIYKDIFGNSRVSVKYTMKRLTVDFNKRIDIDRLNNILKHDHALKKYKYSAKFKRISFTKEHRVQVMTFTVNRTGKIQIILTPNENNTLNEAKASKYILGLIGDIPDIGRDRLKTAVRESLNIRSVPGFKKKTGLKPQVCTGNNKIVPKPYAFGGRCERDGYAPDDDGVPYNKAKNQNVKILDRYGPCCYKVTGKGPGPGFNDTSLPNEFVAPKLTIEQYLKKCTARERNLHVG